MDGLEDKKYTLSTCSESLKKDLEEMKTENEKVVSREDQGVQTDFYICYEEESATNSANTSSPRRELEKDLQLQIWQDETQDRLRSKKAHGDNNTQTQ